MESRTADLADLFSDFTGISITKRKLYSIQFNKYEEFLEVKQKTKGGYLSYLNLLWLVDFENELRLIYLTQNENGRIEFPPMSNTTSFSEITKKENTQLNTSFENSLHHSTLSTLQCVNCHNYYEYNDITTHINDCCDEFLKRSFLSTVLDVFYYSNQEINSEIQMINEENEGEDVGKKILGYLIVLTKSDILIKFHYSDYLLFVNEEIEIVNEKEIGKMIVHGNRIFGIQTEGDSDTIFEIIISLPKTTKSWENMQKNSIQFIPLFSLSSSYSFTFSFPFINVEKEKFIDIIVDNERNLFYAITDRSSILLFSIINDKFEFVDKFEDLHSKLIAKNPSFSTIDTAIVGVYCTNEEESKIIHLIATTNNGVRLYFSTFSRFNENYLGKEFKEETNGAETLLLFSIKFPEKKYKDILYQSPAYISPHLFVLPSEASAVIYKVEFDYNNDRLEESEQSSFSEFGNIILIFQTDGGKCITLEHRKLLQFVILTDIGYFIITTTEKTKKEEQLLENNKEISNK